MQGCWYRLYLIWVQMPPIEVATHPNAIDDLENAEHLNDAFRLIDNFPAKEKNIS